MLENTLDDWWGSGEAKGVRRNKLRRSLCGGDQERIALEIVTNISAAEKSSKERPEKYEQYLVPPFESNSREESEQEWGKGRS